MAGSDFNRGVWRRLCLLQYTPWRLRPSAQTVTLRITPEHLCKAGLDQHILRSQVGRSGSDCFPFCPGSADASKDRGALSSPEPSRCEAQEVWGLIADGIRYSKIKRNLGTERASASGLAPGLAGKHVCGSRCVLARDYDSRLRPELAMPGVCAVASTECYAGLWSTCIFYVGFLGSTCSQMRNLTVRGLLLAGPVIASVFTAT